MNGVGFLINEEMVKNFPRNRVCLREDCKDKSARRKKDKKLLPGTHTMQCFIPGGEIG